MPIGDGAAGLAGMAVQHGLWRLGEIPGELHLAIGVFDGVHRGHQQVIGSACEAARMDGGVAVVVTFEPHPIRVLAPARAPRMLASIDHKWRILSRLGVKDLVVVEFDAEFAQCPAEEFVAQLLAAGQGRIRSIAVGEDWRFGAKARGDLALLTEVAARQRVVVRGVARVESGGERISSTRIRAAILDGHLELASRLLGRPYTVLGTVISGRQLGRELGFPTANLRVHSEQLPPSGVYVARVELPDGQRLGGVANLGLRPTVEGGETQRRLEVHLFDFAGDLYGQDLEVEFVGWLRGERKFGNLEELTSQIQLDALEARKYLEMNREKAEWAGQSEQPAPSLKIGD